MDWNMAKKDILDAVKDGMYYNKEQLVYATIGDMEKAMKRFSRKTADELESAINYLDKNKQNIAGDVEPTETCILNSNSLHEAIDCIVNNTKLPEVPLGIIAHIGLPIAIIEQHPKLNIHIINHVDF